MVRKLIKSHLYNAIEKIFVAEEDARIKDWNLRKSVVDMARYCVSMKGWCRKEAGEGVGRTAKTCDLDTDRPTDTH